MNKAGFGKPQLLALLGPLAVTATALAYWTVTALINPAAGIAAPQYEVLLYAALWSAAVTVIAVPVAVVRLWRNAPLRTAGNIIATLAGAIPLPICAFLWLALLLGLG